MWRIVTAHFYRKQKDPLNENEKQIVISGENSFSRHYAPCLLVSEDKKNNCYADGIVLLQ